ncbi:phosphoglycerate mutase 1 family [Desulfarculus baarsii DSM 2075]|uniref:2,3-bisphosphoglycerate-dependent phosphoglycerate mutase n=1 Tax=Desulfarculus baarsii (strain ATCC 33931 / DSM 2075 / LMG 7858 / VKM B-1802 / 2st14) TaxID=644282 RepID=E1QEF6_DESB2|nr:2,3-diphosphoglycerate-dependent phosphoglycerate mutase [Desulfarculus baarsii]ADK83942.1 phosphoglycerate mutase 1 family [Desulfarculus baarsii DSM 2075]
MPRLLLVRHGQSQWNLENRFTGWTDVDLSPLGEDEARQAGRLLQTGGYSFDVAFTSVLKRAVRTLWLIMERMDLYWVEQHAHWRLNERHYGALQGLNKQETTQRHGAEQVRLWRRSFDAPPPSLDGLDPRHPRFDRRYRGVETALLPGGESLKDTLGRVLPYWTRAIEPRLRMGQDVVVAAHGNSLRALVKHLDHVSDADIVNLEIPTGNPLVYRLAADLSVLDRAYLDQDRAQALP